MQTRVFPANGLLCGVRLPKGESVLAFSYRSPGAFAGCIVSCATLALGIPAALLAFSAIPRRYVTGVGILSVAAIGIGLPWCWHQSVYGGQDIGTKYAWNGETLDTSNLAYGRRTEMSEVSSWSDWYRLCAGRGVDGERTPGSGFRTRPVERPTWAVDLGGIYPVERVMLYEGDRSPAVNRRPLEVGGSRDDRTWEVLGTIQQPVTGGPLELVLDTPVLLRYLFVRAGRPCALALDEVEVFGPAAPGSSPPVQPRE